MKPLSCCHGVLLLTCDRRLIGLLKVGVPKTWEESRKDLKYIRQAGVRQFISTYNRVKDLEGDELLWGDEIEYGVFMLDPENKKVRLSLRAKEVRFCIFAFHIRCVNKPLSDRPFCFPYLLFT
jgi:hypothetical protein